jgi:hypothetical protein
MSLLKEQALFLGDSEIDDSEDNGENQRKDNQ